MEKAWQLKSTRVLFVMFSPDGKHIASGGDDTGIRVWDTETGRPVHTLEGHTENVLCGAYSPDGTRFVSGSKGGTLRLWDARSGLPIGKPMTGHTRNIESVTFSSDGSSIVSASVDGTIRLWNGLTGEASGELLTEHKGGSLLSPNGNLAAFLRAQDYTIHIWDVKAGSTVGEPLKGHTAAIFSFTFSADERFIYSCSRDGTIRCWDVHTASSIGTPLISQCHTPSVVGVSVLRDGRRIVSGGWDHAIRVWDAEAFHWDRDQSWLSCGLRGPHQIPGHVPDDGWIRGSEGGGLVLWVPTAHREAVCRIYELCIAENDGHPIRIDWDRLCHGEGWTEIHG